MASSRFPWFRFGAVSMGILVAVIALYSVLAATFQPTRLGLEIALVVRGATTAFLIFLYGRHLLIVEFRRAEAAQQEAQRTRRLLEAVLGQLPLGVFICDADGRPVYLNARGEEILGQGLRPDAQGSQLSTTYQTYRRGTDELYPPDELPVMRALRGDGDVWADDLEVHRPDGIVEQQVWARAVLEDGRPVYAVAVFEDVTERRKQEAQEREHVRAVQLDKLRRRFVNAAAHELYTPLTPLRIQLRALASAKDGEARERAARLMQRNVDRIEAVVRRLLRLAELETEGTVQVRAALDVADLVHAATASLAHKADEAGVFVGVDATSVAVIGDAARLEDALVNLLDNAIKYSRRGGRVDVVAVRDGGEARIEICDDGTGLVPGSEAFRPFHRVLGEHDGETKEGWGLGLYIARLIVTEHGGRLDIGADPDGHGVRARVWLPLAGDEEE